MRRSAVTPSASASNCKKIRCRNAGWATALRSSNATLYRPSRSARTLAASTTVCRPRGLAPHDLEQVALAREGHQNFKEESVQLRLGQRVRALKLDRVLRREDEEGRRQ